MRRLCPDQPNVTRDRVASYMCRGEFYVAPARTARVTAVTAMVAHVPHIEFARPISIKEVLVAKLHGSALAKQAALEEVRRKWDHVYSLVKQAQARSDIALMRQINRSAAAVARVLTESGFGGMAQSVTELEVMSRRAKVDPGKLRTMAELVAGVRSLLDQAERRLHKDAEQAAAEQAAED